MSIGLNTRHIAHRFLKEHVQPGAFCIDATAGRGRDTLLLCQLAGKKGKVLAFDIQLEAVASTRKLLEENSMSNWAYVFLESHTNIDLYAEPKTADAIVFNFGWLPGGDHTLHTETKTSLDAIQKGLKLLKPGGIMSLCLYYGKETGFAETDAILKYLETVDNQEYTVVVSSFANRPNCPPIAVCILRDDIKSGEENSI